MLENETGPQVVDEIHLDIGEKYHERIAKISEYEFTQTEVRASVIVVLYRTSKRELAEVFDALSKQTCDDFDIIIIDNGTDWDVESALEKYANARYYIRLIENEGVTFARNLGAQVADSDLLIFLDDDGFPRADFVEQHLAIHDQNGIVAARGKVKPKNENVYNRSRGHYDLGEEVQPSFIGTECNASFDADVFLEVSGFSESLPGRAGHEGLELTYRILQADYEKDQIIYHPGAVTYHDFADGIGDYIRKNLERKRNNYDFKREHPELWNFGSQYYSDQDHLKRPLPLVVVDAAITVWFRILNLIR